jgi:hypothetical protein
MDDISPAGEQPRYVPHGVDAETWIGFEQRIQERRYRALLHQIDEAILRRDGIAARLALEEARELRPDAEDLNELSESVALIPVTLPPASATPFILSRAMNAVALLVAGVALLVAIEYVRPPRPLPSSRAAVSDVSAPSALTAPSSAPTPEEPVGSSAPPADGIVASSEPDLAIPDPVATSGVQPAVNIARPAVGGPATATFRPQTLVDSPIPAGARELPDDNAAADLRRQREANIGTGENASVTSANADDAAAEPSRVTDASPASPDASSDEPSSSSTALPQ